MRILVIGASGQVARELLCAAPPAGAIVTAAGRPQLDLTQRSSIDRTLDAAAPDLIINAAAWTDVERAESESDAAFAVNALGAGDLALAARSIGARLIHISTDFVFDGRLGRPYAEEDAPAPLNAYGRSKLAGERAVLDSGADAKIVRVAWVYSPHGRNFVSTMLRLARSGREEIGVVDDQRGTPTSAADIAAGLFALAARWPDDRLLHLASPASASWADFADAIFAASRAVGGPHARVRRITSADYGGKVERPVDSRLSSQRFERAIGFAPPGWPESLPLVVRTQVSAGSVEI